MCISGGRDSLLQETRHAAERVPNQPRADASLIDGLITINRERLESAMTDVRTEGSASAASIEYTSAGRAWYGANEGDDWMTPVEPDCELGRWRHEFLLCLNDTARYAASRGSPLFLPGHISFLMAYARGWQKQEPGPDKDEAVIEALFYRIPRSAKHLVLRLSQAEWIPGWVRQLLLLTPFAISLLWQFIWSGMISAKDILGNGIRSVPPLVTAVVVIFVTSDAWRILGTGFTPRFFTLVIAFLLASLFFLVRRDWWADVVVDDSDVESMLNGIRRWKTDSLNKLMDRGAKPVRMEKPGGIRAVCAYLTYLTLIAFALIAVAVFVSIILIIVGLILVNANETKNIAGSVYAYESFSGIVATKQLFSLSLSLGAFAAFFLVAAQRSDDRNDFIKNILDRYRRAMLVYTIYCQARDSAEELTRMSIAWKPHKHGC